MTATDGREIEIETEEMVRASDAGRLEGSAIDSGYEAGERSHGMLPWIGALSNPRLGPMLVINDSGYLVPLCTAGDLLRGCKYFWRNSRD
jgi:hypothetical protein